MNRSRLWTVVRTAALWTLALALVPSVVRAQGTEGSMAAGRAALAEGNLEQADRHFRAAHLSGAGTSALFNLGFVADRRDQCVATMFYFSRVVEEAPNDPDRAALEARIARCEKRIGGSLGVLEVRSRPAGAQVSLRADSVLGHPAGVHELWLDAPLTVKLPPGRYQVQVRKDRYLTTEILVEVTAGKRELAEVALNRAPPKALPVVGPSMGPIETDAVLSEPVRSTPAPVVVVEPERPMGPLTPWGWTAIGVGAASAAAAVALHLVGTSQMEKANADHGAGTPEYVDGYNGGRSLYQGGIGLYATAGALLTTGIVLLIMDEPPAEGASAHVSPFGVPGGGGFSATVRF